MTNELSEATKHVADELIAMSRALDKNMETWSDVIADHPDSPNNNVSAGFITKQSAATGVQMVIDIQAPPDEKKAVLRTWAIEIGQDGEGNERFNNIQLSYRVDYAQARRLVERAGTLTRDDIARLLHNAASQLDLIVISDQTGRDETSHQLLGKRYELDSAQLQRVAESLQQELTQAITTVLERLKQSATKERNR